MYPPTLSVNEEIYLLHAIEIAISCVLERSKMARVVRRTRQCLLHHLASSVAYMEFLRENAASYMYLSGIVVQCSFGYRVRGSALKHRRP